MEHPCFQIESVKGSVMPFPESQGLYKALCVPGIGKQACKCWPVGSDLLWLLSAGLESTNGTKVLAPLAMGVTTKMMCILPLQLEQGFMGTSEVLIRSRFRWPSSSLCAVC